ncbi:DUF2075 domain-containing protein [Neolewinella lacunae]|uniref:DUF2075 domain-containing protein n=1 Tax=Neolewinella lacunae TaxID=1517758 RepID=A0A923T6W3_9BACT|nr:DNA/RNA helicase domain-containing protein [Neolewinella lacunae]MBC6992934.1 DUF2075 domain-containing protein [Neolewinella lacunae]MDN3633702.1 DUF2075 domain-containing protein [Neolewinella lacunae]
MIETTNFSVDEFDLDRSFYNKVIDHSLAKDNWPIVYILSDGTKKVAYVGETIDTISRMKMHFSHELKQKLTAIHLISSDQFNKSVTLDIESNLIKYMAADKQFTLLNGNLGIANHNYYQKNKYWDLFVELWNKLQKKGLAERSLSFIENLNLFKYSPYKSLSAEQNEGLLNILKSLAEDTHKNTLVEGGAGTGKSILAIFLFKLLTTSTEDLNFQEFGENEVEIISLVEKIKKEKPNFKMALVIPMSSFRKTLQNVFSQINGLSPQMVVGPSEIASQRYDLVVVDEAHRLRQRVNLGAYFGSFDQASKKLGLDSKKNNELDWILQQADRTVFFYDANQSIKPSDVPKESFDRLIASPATRKQKLHSQFRVRGGNDYVEYIDRLLNGRLVPGANKFKHPNYDLKLFYSLEQMVEKIKQKNKGEGLSRLIAGFSWPWVSNPKKRKKPEWEPYDIIEDGVYLRWNTTDKDWINTPGSEDEVGCIHTTQGYDLNYAGIIFGNEISYNPDNNEIIVHKEKYHDKNGKNTINDPQRLVDYVINIYKTMMLRGIKGTYIYVCDKDLRNYFSQFIPVIEQRQEAIIKVLPSAEVKRYVNSVPLYHLTALAGGFSDVQAVEYADWIELPAGITPSEDLFACRVVGNSMNKVIPDGAICLFNRNITGSRGGKTLLIELRDYTDPDTESAFTVKEYWSKKIVLEDGFFHTEIILKPNSRDPNYKNIVVTPDMAEDMKILGVYERVLDGDLSIN